VRTVLQNVNARLWIFGPANIWNTTWNIRIRKISLEHSRLERGNNRLAQLSSSQPAA
jgi:hypothetical protein